MTHMAARAHGQGAGSVSATRWQVPYHGDYWGATACRRLNVATWSCLRQDWGARGRSTANADATANDLREQQRLLHAGACRRHDNPRRSQLFTGSARHTADDRKNIAFAFRMRRGPSHRISNCAGSGSARVRSQAGPRVLVARNIIVRRNFAGRHRQSPACAPPDWAPPRAPRAGSPAGPCDGRI